MNQDVSIHEYILQHIDDQGDYLRALYRDTQVKLLRPRMASGHLQGRILKMFVQMVQPQNILEIGTYSGYSALCMAEGLSKQGAMLYTFEINDELEDFTRPWIQNSAYSDKIVFQIGDVMEYLPTMNMLFDLSFIDGDKRLYEIHYQEVLKHTTDGGYILIDNTLWDGHVLKTPPITDPQTKAIIDFNNLLAQDNRVEKVILPIRDGLTIVRKRIQHP